MVIPWARTGAIAKQKDKSLRECMVAESNNNSTGTDWRELKSKDYLTDMQTMLA